MKTSFIKKLGYSDSNQEKQDQNLLCYHYTIAQNFILVIPSRFDAAKVQLFHNIPSISPFFFQKKSFFSSFFPHFSLITLVRLSKNPKGKEKYVGFFRNIQKSQYICLPNYIN